MATVLITGANRGIGLEFTRQYANEGWTVMACCRDLDGDGAAELRDIASGSAGRVLLEKMDMLDHASIDAVASKYRGKAIDDDPDYLQGLAAGVDAMKRWEVQDCSYLVSRGYESARRGVPQDRRGEDEASQKWRRGYDDGQRLVYGIIVLERIDQCYVPVPPVPGGGDLMGAEITHHDSTGPRER